MSIDWVALVGIIIGSSALGVLVKALVDRKSNNQQIEFNYQAKLEERIEKLERRLDVFEVRDNIYSSAIACTYACKSNPGECPALNYIKGHPVPEKQ